jgi:hypothetical protein
MAEVVTTHSVGLSEDKQTVRMEITREGQALSVDLGIADVDLLIDAVSEMRGHMVESSPTA